MSLDIFLRFVKRLVERLFAGKRKLSYTKDPMYKLITSQELKDLIDSKEPFVLLDVRGEDEWKAGHIGGAVFMPHWFVSLKIGDVVSDKKTKIVAYCLSGGRSSVAAKTLVDMGYTDVASLEGGYGSYMR